MNKQFDIEKNYEYFYSVIKDLSKSQGFYGRLLRQLDNADDELIESFKNDLPEFKDCLDVVFYIEQ